MICEGQHNRLPVSFLCPHNTDNTLDYFQLLRPYNQRSFPTPLQEGRSRPYSGLLPSVGCQWLMSTGVGRSLVKWAIRTDVDKMERSQDNDHIHRKKNDHWTIFIHFYEILSIFIWPAARLHVPRDPTSAYTRGWSAEMSLVSNSNLQIFPTEVEVYLIMSSCVLSYKTQQIFLTPSSLQPGSNFPLLTPTLTVSDDSFSLRIHATTIRCHATACFPNNGHAYIRLSLIYLGWTRYWSVSKDSTAQFDVCVTAHRRYNNINKLLDAKIAI